MVDVGLDEDVGKGSDGKLQGGGDADGAYLSQDAAAKLQSAQVNPVIRAAADQHGDDQQRRDTLGDHRGDGGPGNTHVEKLDEQNIQHRVGQGGEDEKIQGVGGVAHSPEDTGADVVQQQPGDAHKVDSEIFHRLHKHIVGGVHHFQHIGRQRHAQHRQRHAHDQRQRDGGLHGGVELFPVLGAVILRDHHAGAGGQAGKKPDKGVDDRPGTAHGGKGLLVHVVSHHDGVHSIVKLLKDIPDQQRERKMNQQPGDAALGHVGVAALENGSQILTLQMSVVCFKYILP